MDYCTPSVSLPLLPFENSNDGSLRIFTRVQTTNTRLKLFYEITGFASIPMFRETQRGVTRGQRKDHLWKTTCLEVFLSEGQRPEDPYHEWNFSPRLDWQYYAFSAYRERRTDQGKPTPPQMEWSLDPETQSLQLSVEIDRPMENRPLSDLWIGVTAVIEDQNAELTYWALRHATAQPDFHDKRTFLPLESFQSK